MTITEMLSALRSQGIHLWVEGEKLKYRAPHGALTAELRSQLIARKAELLTYLKSGNLPVTASFPSIARTVRIGDLPLSFAEEGLWLLEQLRPGFTAWNMQSMLRISGALSLSLLEKSLNSLVQRQEILRTAFELRDQTPSRVIASELRIELPVLDLHGSSSPDEEIRRIAADEIKTPFDLSKAPLFRAKLLRLSEMEHILLLTKHHIITDAWSAMLFFRELFVLYEVSVSHVPPALVDLPIQYSDYAFWLRHLRTREMESHLSYWKGQLAGMHWVELPCDKPRNTHRSFRGATERVLLSPILSRALRELCKHERTTPFMTLLAAFKALVCRYTGESDIVIGSTVAGRNKPELEPLIGLFINLVVLRSDLAGEPTFREVLVRVREVCLQAHQHQDYPFEKLVQELSPTREPSRNGFFQVLFNFVNLPSIPKTVTGLTLERIARPRDTARFDLTLYTPETAEGFEIIAAYNRDLFSSERIQQMLEQYKHLLEQVVKNPDRKIIDYSLVTPWAKQWLPDPTATLDESWQGAVHELFANHAAQQPDKLAAQDPREAWTYKELNDRSNRLARYFLAHEIGREDIIVIHGHRSAALVCALLGVLKAGAAFCMIDPSHPTARVKEFLSAADPKALIRIASAGEPTAEMAEMFACFPLRCKITLPSLATAEACEFLSQYSQENPELNFFPDDLAYVIFTSGSTGKPKGVMGRHGPLTHFLPWLRETFGLSENDRFSFLSGLATNKLQRELFTALGLGGTVCIPDPDDIGAFGKLDAWLRQEAVTVVHLTPAMAQLLDETATQPIPAVRKAFFGGDLLRLRDVDRVRRLMPNAEITNFYNSSETQRGGSYFVFSEQALNEVKETPPLGRGVKDVQLLVLNRAEQLAGVSELGEICVRSPHLARGYLGDDKLTTERFINNPFSGLAGDRMYRTGELGRFLPDGSVEFVSRGQDQVSIRGFRVELGEIEAVLLGHPAVRETAIAAHERTPGNYSLVAYVITANKSSPTAGDLRAFLKEKLPDYMIPAGFIFVESLPLTPTGKVDRQALSLPDAVRRELTSSFVAPRTALEKVLAESWIEILGVEQVGTEDNFFELGGHSLLATQVVTRICHAFDVELPLRSLYEAPTVAALAAALLQVSAEPSRIEKTAELLLKLAQLSEDQVERMLADKRAASETGDG